MRRWSFAVVLVLVSCSAVCWAQQDAKQALARKHFELGEKLYQASDYPAALAEFQSAYQLANQPALLFNIARCHDVMAHLRKAIRYYQLYLDLVPDAKQRGLVELRIVRLKKRLLKKAGKQAAPAPASSPGSQPASYVPLPFEPPPPLITTWKTSVGIGCVALGGAALAGGFIVGAVAKNKADEYNLGVRQQAPYYHLNEIDQQGRQLDSVALALMISGGVVAATGIGLMFWDRLTARRASGEQAAVLAAPMVGRDLVGVSGQVTF